MKTSVPKTKSVVPTPKTKDRLPTTTVTSSSKRDNEQKRLLLKSQPKTQSTVHQENRRSKILDTTKKTGQTSVEKRRTKPRISIASKLKDQRKNTSDTPVDEQIISSSTTARTEAFDGDAASKPQIEREGIRSFNLKKSMKTDCFMYIEDLIAPNTSSPHIRKVIF
jgi:hypothetical protein